MPGQYGAAYADPEGGMGAPLKSQSTAAKLQAQKSISQAQKSSLKVVMNKPDFLVTWLVPAFVFMGVILLYTFGFMNIPTVCVVISVSLFFGGSVMLSLRNKGHIWLPLGVTLLVATATGTGLGLYIYDQYAVFPMFYRNARLYSDVVPSLPSRAVSDAGRIVFSTGSTVDVSRAVGYVTEAGSTYCVAPIHDGTASSRVEFWAVGLGCCGERGTFDCDQVADTSARAGVRVFDNAGWFADSNLDFYNRARMKAEATYGMLPSGSALYVRWVREDNMRMLSSFYSLRVGACLAFFILLYFGAAMALAHALYKPRGSPP